MATRSLFLAKITKPRLQRILPRKRLYQLISESFSFPAIWVTGPGGSGKTTLVASYLDDCGLPHIWYHIDETDADPAAFFYYMGLAGKKAVSGAPEFLPPLTPEYAQDITIFTRRYFEALFDRVKKPFALVLDNYHVLEPGCPLHEILYHALAVIPENVNVFILSRTDPPAPLARPLAGSLLYMIDWDELRLKLNETREMVFLWSRRPHSEASIESLHKKTDGWIAGLLLLLNRNSPRASDPEFITPYTPHEVFDYFASELFSDADPELQNFLLRTAILPRMTAKMAAAISGISDAGRILTQMMRNHWFTERRLGTGRKAPPCRRPGGTGHRSSL